MKRLATVVLCGALLVACSQAPARGLSHESGSSGRAVASPSATADPISVVTSRYGSFEIKTQPLASCALSIDVFRGAFGDGPPKTLNATADNAGRASWSYPAPLVPAGRGTHTATCSSELGRYETRSDFHIDLKALDAKSFAVRVAPVDPVSGLVGLSTRLEPSLVPARDAAVAKMGQTLDQEWSRATRGLGAVKVVTSAADIVIYVVPARSSSVHVTSRDDGTQRILIYVVDDIGPVVPENAVAVALHELGHIWCCYGPDAGPDGHWLEKIPDPLLGGIDRYGLMTHPVTCIAKPGLVSCPNRFSERELRAMGFTQIPPPAPDACLVRQSALVAQLNAVERSLASARAAIDSTNAEITGLADEIRSLERQYPRGMPPDVYARYVALLDAYNRKVAENDARIDAFNRDVEKQNSLAGQLNALPC